MALDPTFPKQPGDALWGGSHALAWKPISTLALPLEGEGIWKRGFAA
jgi:hypothetical protein